MPTLATAYSFLFAPGSDLAKLSKALGSDAHVVIADLEDAVLPSEKERARAVVAEAFGAAPRGPLRFVRVNGADTRWHDGDLSLVEQLSLDGIVLPKATPEAAASLEALGLPVVAIVETADGLRRSYELAATPPVVALQLGAVDLSLALGLESRADGQQLLFARSTLVLHSAAAGLRTPIDQVWTHTRDLAGLASDCALGRALGFRAKACIHPAQIETVHAAFAPSLAELARARTIVDAFEQAAGDGAGAVALDGEMIDLPVVERARQLLSSTKGDTRDGC